jgi:hypothetical protein
MTSTKWYDPGDHLPWLLPLPKTQPRTQLDLFPQHPPHNDEKQQGSDPGHGRNDTIAPERQLH